MNRVAPVGLFDLTLPAAFETLEAALAAVEADSAIAGSGNAIPACVAGNAAQPRVPLALPALERAV